MATADRLLDLMYSWMEKRKHCAEKLKKLAKELESQRKLSNGAECVGSSVSVVGVACLIGAGAATLFTGGAAAPLLGLAGALYSGVGITISVAAKITEHFLSSDTMKEALKVDEESNKIGEKIQKLFKQLKEEKKKLSPLAGADELDQHAMAEFLTAIGRKTGVKGQISVRTVNNETMFYFDAGPRCGIFNFNVRANSCVDPLGSLLINTSILVLVLGIWEIFALKAGKKATFLLADGVKQLMKLMTSAAFKTALKGGAKVVGGAVAMAFALSEAIDNWTDMIKNNHVTEASQSLRDTADKINEGIQTLKRLFDDVKMEFNEMAERQRREVERLRQVEAERQQREVERLRQVEAERQQREVERLRQVEAERQQREVERLRQVEAERQRREEKQCGKKKNSSRKSDEPKPGGFPFVVCFIFGRKSSIYSQKPNNYETEASKSLRESTCMLMVSENIKEEPCETEEITVITPPYTISGVKTCAIFEANQSDKDEQESERAEQSKKKDQTKSDQKRSGGGQQAGGGQGGGHQGGGHQGGGHQGGGHQGGGDQGGGDQGHDRSDSETEKSDQEEEESDSEEQTDDVEESNQNCLVNTALLNLWSMRKVNATARILDLIRQDDISMFLTTETWLDASNVHRFLREASPPNFRYFSYTRPSRGGGVAIQLSPDLRGKQILSDHIQTTFRSVEFVAAVLQHDDWDEPVVIINLYRPPRCNMKTLLNTLQDILLKVSKKYKNIIVTGDFNIWVDDPIRGAKFQQFLQDNNLVQHVRQPTHRRNHILDLVVTRNVEISDLIVRNDGISDHFTILFKLRPKKTEEKEDEDENEQQYKKSEE